MARLKNEPSDSRLSDVPPQQRVEAEAIFMSIGDGAISTDEFGRITRINPVGLRILGYSDSSELIGAWFPGKIIAVNAKDEPYNLIDRPITRAFLTGNPVTDKVFYRRRDGQLVPVSVIASPILMDGRPLGAIEVFRDITIEEEIDQMKSEFISLASHQLRTPLSTIKTYSHMIVEGYLGKIAPEQKRALRTIIGATNRMNELISTLLNITRIESGTIDVSPKLLSVDKLADEVVKNLSIQASTKAISLSLKVSGKGTTNVKTDALLASEVLTNLVSNAIKYTPEGGIVDIIIRPRARDVHVSVRDNGWGIPRHVQDQVFSKFFRAHNIVKRETTGTGLGLYMVKGLLDRLGGTITFTSDEGKGTTFQFTLPRRPPKAKTPSIKP